MTCASACHAYASARHADATGCDAYRSGCDAYRSGCDVYRSGCDAYRSGCDACARVCLAYPTGCEAYATGCHAYPTACEAYPTGRHAGTSCEAHARGCQAYPAGCEAHARVCQAYPAGCAACATVCAACATVCAACATVCPAYAAGRAADATVCAAYPSGRDVSRICGRRRARCSGRAGGRHARTGTRRRATLRHGCPPARIRPPRHDASMSERPGVARISTRRRRGSARWGSTRRPRSWGPSTRRSLGSMKTCQASRARPAPDKAVLRRYRSPRTRVARRSAPWSWKRCASSSK